MDTHIYLQEYIQTALTSESLPKPDPMRANGNYEVLTSLYEAHRLTGSEGANKAWKTIIHLRPELIEVFPLYEPTRVKLPIEDVWALRRATSGQPFDPTVKTSPLIRLMIQTLKPRELEQFLMADAQLFDDMLGLDPDVKPHDQIAAGLLIPFGKLEDLPLPPYAIDRYPIYERGLNLIYGLPGVGKSFIAVDFLGHVAASNPDKAVIYVAPEGWSSIPARWKAWCLNYGKTPENILLMRQSLRVTNARQLEAFKDEIAELGLDVHFIVFDTLARAMVGDNENDTREMNLFIDTLDHMRDELDCGMLLVHHVNKLGQLRGSTALDGALDSIIRVNKEDSQLVLHNRQDKGGKNRHRPEADPIYLNLKTVEVQMRGLVDNAGVVEVVERRDPAESADTLNPRQRELLEALDGYGEGMTVSQIYDATNIPKPTIYRYLKQLGAADYLNHNRNTDQIAITDKGRSTYRS